MTSRSTATAMAARIRMTPIAAWSPDDFLAGGFLAAGGLLAGGFFGGVRLPAGTFFIDRVWVVTGGCGGQREWVGWLAGAGVGRVVAGGGSRGPCGTTGRNW